LDTFLIFFSLSINEEEKKMFSLIIFILGMSLCAAITSRVCTIAYHFAIRPCVLACPEFLKVIEVAIEQPLKAKKTSRGFFSGPSPPCLSDR
jgi:hypothetical protein